MTVERLVVARQSSNPDDIQAYIESLAKMLGNTAALNRNPIVAYALASQMLPRARDQAPDRVDDLAKALADLQQRAPDATSEIQAHLFETEPPNPEGGEIAARQYRIIGQIQTAIAGGRFDQARSLLPDIDTPNSRSQLAALIAFGEAARAIADHDDRAFVLVNALPAGVKRSLLYAGMVATAPDANSARQALSLLVPDAKSLPAEHRIRVYSAAATAALRWDTDAFWNMFNELASSYNDAYVNPRRVRFNPRSRITSTDSPFILPGRQGFYEAVATEHGRHNFTLRVAGANSFSMASVIAGAGAAEPARLEAVLLGLLDESLKANSLVGLAALRLKPEPAEPAK